MHTLLFIPSPHLTLNPSPEGEGLSSIPVGMVAPFLDDVLTELVGLSPGILALQITWAKLTRPGLQDENVLACQTQTLLPSRKYVSLPSPTLLAY